jgi:hypothetical protein
MEACRPSKSGLDNARTVGLVLLSVALAEIVYIARRHQMTNVAQIIKVSPMSSDFYFSASLKCTYFQFLITDFYVP